MKKALVLASLFLLPIALLAQAQLTVGNITAAGSDCTTTNACVVTLLPANSGSVSFSVSGTFSGTLQFEVSVDGTQAKKSAVNCFPPNSTTAATSTTATGTWTCAVPGMTQFQVRGSAYSSGTAVVNISTSNAISVANLAGGGGGAPTNGTQYINAAGAPYNLLFDAGAVLDGSITNGSTVLTSASANWLTSAKTGQRIWAVESGGGNKGKLAFMGTIVSIDSNTQVHVSQTSACSSTAPCTSLSVRWGTGGQNVAAQQFIADISNINNPKPTCGVIPPGGFVWEAAWNGYPAFSVETSVCLKGSVDQTVFYPTPDYGFTPGGQISFANSITLSQFVYGNFQIDGSYLTTTDGRTPVFQGIGGGASCFFLSQIYTENLACQNWGSGVSGWQCAKLDNYQTDINFRCINAGEVATQGSFLAAPVRLFGGEISDSANGNAAFNIGSPTVTTGVSFGQNDNVWRCVDVTGSASWTSIGDSCNNTLQEALEFTGTGVVKITGMTVVGATGKSVLVSSGSNGPITISDSVITAQSGQAAIDSAVYSGGPMYDVSGNTITGTSTDFCISAGGTCGTASKGEVTIAAAATTVTVATTAVTATSRISVTENATLGVPLGSITCNTATNVGAPFVSAITAGTSFVITVPVTPAANPACFNFTILNPGE